MVPYSTCLVQVVTKNFSLKMLLVLEALEEVIADEAFFVVFWRIEVLTLQVNFHKFRHSSQKRIMACNGIVARLHPPWHFTSAVKNWRCIAMSFVFPVTLMALCSFHITHVGLLRPHKNEGENLTNKFFSILTWPKDTSFNHLDVQS